MYSKMVDKNTWVKYDQIGKLETYYSKIYYPDKLRRFKYYVDENNMELIFITNNFTLKATEIELSYKKCWKVELFFK